MRFWPLLLWIIWLGLLGLLTWGLLSPQAPQVSNHLLPPVLRFWAAKGVHLFGYLIISAMVGWLPLGWLGRWLLWLLLSCHAGLTEYLQQFVAGRHGTWEDVGLDMVGVVLGIVLALLLAIGKRQQVPLPEEYPLMGHPQY